MKSQVHVVDWIDDCFEDFNDVKNIY